RPASTCCRALASGPGRSPAYPLREGRGTRPGECPLQSWERPPHFRHNRGQPASPGRPPPMIPEDRAPLPASLLTEVKAVARRLGFLACGITTLEPLPHAEALDRWLKEGLGGNMRY